jgi:uncharacterized protein (DUF2141 family)
MLYKFAFRLALRRISAIAFLCLTQGRFQNQLPQDLNTISVAVHHLRNDQGTVVVLLFNGADGFPKQQKAFKVLTTKIVNRTATVDFNGLPAGVYGLAVFHDENSNGKMDTNFFGIPKEGVGASNGAKGHFGPPKFNDAAFPLETKTKSIDITVAYL